MSRKQKKTVRQIAEEGHVELDEALVLLWDAGFDSIESPNDYLGPRDLNRARRALGLATRRELQSIKYWRSLLGMPEEELAELLAGTGYVVGGPKRRLPRKAISRLKARATELGLDPVTGELVAAEDSAVSVAAEEWQAIGHEADPEFLSADEVVAVHWALVSAFANGTDPIDPPGVRSQSLLESAVYRPHTAIGDTLKYSTLETSCAALIHSIVLDHPFFNGNKRTALVSFLLVLERNGLFLEATENALFKLVLQVAQHSIAGRQRPNRDDREVLAIARWLCDRSRLAEKGDRPIPWRRMRRILVDYGCELTFPGGVGNRINIRRSVRRRGFLGRSKTVALTTQVHYSDDGRDVGRSTTKKIRADLELDYEHGVDSQAFYDKEPVQAEEFIYKYRDLLRRLARL